jgi:CMP-N,N'-diacetyllegionaminic acid synthase
MRLLISICARGGSKGIPGKNLRLLNGKPLIAYSIEVAGKFAKWKDCVISLSTDSEEIRAVAENFGLLSDYLRPASLATDTAGKIPVIKDLLLYEEKKAGDEFDYVLDLDVTSPLLNENDLKAAFAIIENDEEALNLFSVNHANRNPYFNMVEKQENGYFGLVKKGTFLTRQSAPEVYELNASFYFYRRSFFNNEHPVTITERSLVYVMPHICFDLDHPVDFDFMDFLLTSNKLGFEL